MKKADKTPMGSMDRRWGLAALALSFCGGAFAAEAAAPVKHLGLFVEPYYQASQDPAKPPRVAVGGRFDALLASTDPKDIDKARALAQQSPSLVTPMTLMALAIRYYDVGQREEGLFWYYAARDRYMVSTMVLDYDSGALGNVRDAMRAFVSLAGPFFNGYAFCDVRVQQAEADRAGAWTFAHPYLAYEAAAVPRKAGDPKDNMAKGEARLRAFLAQETEWSKDPRNLATLAKGRAENEADAKFCWN